MPVRLSRLLRLLPSLVVMVLLFTAAAGMRSPNAPAAAAALNCDSTLVASLTNDAYPVGSAFGVTQPFDPTTNVQACSLRVQTYYNYDDVKILAWDSAANLPDASTVPLRYFSFDPSQMQRNHLRLDFGARPIVTKRLGHLADPPRTRLALDMASEYYGNQQAVYYDHSGPASTPGALEYPTATNVRTPIAGNHAVLSYGLCPGDAATQALVLAQCVMTANITLDTLYHEVYQPFRVPATVTLQFIELAQDVPFGNPYSSTPGLIQIFDGAGPPSGNLPLLTQAVFSSNDVLAQWTSHVDFDQSITLVAGREYGLLLRTAHQYRFRARVLTGAESSDFANGIGTLFGRTSLVSAWASIPDRALSMRIIGTPSGTVEAPSPPLAPGARFKLSLTPNPSHGAVSAAWSGGVGRAHVEVLDARGRRVSGATTEGAARGRWQWNGADAGGRPVPAGLYFVRLHDDEGHAAVERVAIVR